MDLSLDLSLLPAGAEVLFDSAPLIYWFEDHPLAERFAPLFQAVAAGRLRAVVTPIAVAEVVAGPLRAGKEALAERYRQALCHGHHWRLVPIDAEIAMLAARLRVAHQLRLPDALQAATALHVGCAALVSHDRDFRGIDGLAVLGV